MNVRSQSALVDEEHVVPPMWQVRTSWASTPERRLVTVFKYDPDYHVTGGYAAVKSFPTYEEVRAFIEGAA